VGSYPQSGHIERASARFFVDNPLRQCYDGKVSMDDSMPLMHTPGKRRTNKNITNFAIQAVEEYLGGSKERFWEKGNTAAYVDDDMSLVVTLVDKPILRITKRDQKPEEVKIYSGGIYDEHGNPTNLTRERLNGLLDALGAAQVIPQNVRVSYDPDYNIVYVVRGEEKVALNKSYCTMVGLKSHPSEFCLGDMDIVWKSERKHSISQ
jgi:hypothetical protein